MTFDPHELDHWTDNCQYIYDTYTISWEFNLDENGVPTKYAPSLRVQQQSFLIGDSDLDIDTADWLRSQLAKALDLLVRQEINRRASETCRERVRTDP